MERRRFRGRSVAVLVVGLVMGSLMTAPAGAHIGTTLEHLIGHLKGTFYTKAQVYSKTQADGRYLRAACPAGMVKVGSACVDRYEVSVWSAPTGGTQFGIGVDDYPCDDDGSDCEGEIFARSVAGVEPSCCITWFQAQQALANVGKRLPTNAEWQAAVAGTPDSAACNVQTGDTVAAGSFASCRSNWNVNDMVGNLWEWVADWTAATTACPGWSTFSDDYMCLSGASTVATHPGALVRGGTYGDFGAAGPFATLVRPPQSSELYIGFRGVR